MADIACVGILVADLIGRPIDAIPEKGRLGLVDNMSLHIGGCASNTGISLAKLGVSTSVIGKVGADGLGKFMLQTLEAEGIDTRGMTEDATLNTSASMVLVDADGERTFIHYLGGNAEFRDTDVAWNIANEAKIFHVAGALVMPAFDGEPMAAVLKQARANGQITSLDVVWDATGKWMKTLAPALVDLDYFMPSHSEAQMMTGYEAPSDVAKSLHDHGVKTVALKLGCEGCFVSGPSGVVQVPGFKVEAVDGTGSGDAFDAGLLCGVMNGWDVERSARFANAVGALCVTGVGATTGIRSMQATLDFMASQQNQ
ncbi:MAG: sugar kinase [Chthonomonadales bacterium]